jgi:cytochrome c biogenesis protein CcmG, thiol:disulfide interchange protein DsbE
MESVSRSTKSNLMFFGLLALVLVVYLYVLRPLNQGPHGLTHPAIGATLPEISVNALSDSSVNVINADLAGKVVLINFWATWCPPCVQEFPHLMKIEAKFRTNPDFQMLSITPADAQNEEDVRVQSEAFLEQRGAKLPVFIDRGSAAFVSIVKATNGTGGIPFTVVVDQKGVIRGIWEGYAPGTEVEIETSIQQLLDTKPVKKSPAV